jgi:hypothetical protein
MAVTDELVRGGFDGLRHWNGFDGESVGDDSLAHFQGSALSLGLCGLLEYSEPQAMSSHKGLFHKPFDKAIACQELYSGED